MPRPDLKKESCSACDYLFLFRDRKRDRWRRRCGPATIFSFFKFFEIAIAPGRCRFQRVISLFSLRYFLFEKLSRPLNLLSNSRLTARGRGRLQALWKNPNGRRRL